MTRERKEDFDALSKYISEYRIADNLQEELYLESARSMHKVYFSLLSWHSEYQNNIDNFKKEHTSDEDIVMRLSEVVSDVGSSKFNWLNGSYKASRVMLRSSIENFVRALSAIDKAEQLEEKNVYALFDRASACNVFVESELIKSSYQRLHANYKVLCKDTHTATMGNMDGISSLADYPQYKKKKSKDTADIYVTIMKDMLLILCLLFNSFYHKMHHKNKENILSSIARKNKPAVMAP